MPADSSGQDLAGALGRAASVRPWRIVGACLICTMIGNALGLYGAGIYLRAVTSAHGWPTGLLSGAISAFHVFSALLLPPVGASIGRFGPRPASTCGGIALAAGVAGLGQAEQPWQAYAAFLVMGAGWSCLTMTSVGVALASWFDRGYGRAVSTASLGASLGGMAGAPLILLGIERFGLAATTLALGAMAAATVLPLAIFILGARPPHRDAAPAQGPASTGAAAIGWGGLGALRTVARVAWWGPSASACSRRSASWRTRSR